MEKMIEKGVYLTRSHGCHTQEHQGYDARTTSPVGAAAVPTVHGRIEETISMIAPAVAAFDRHPTAVVVSNFHETVAPARLLKKNLEPLTMIPLTPLRI